LFDFQNLQSPICRICKTVSESAIIADFAKLVLGFAKPSEGGFGLGQMDYFCSLKIEEKE